MAKNKKTYTKRDIVKQLSKTIYGGVDPENVQRCSQFCDCLADIITDALAEGKKISWMNFITMEIIERREHKGLNPRTKEEFVFPPTKTITVKLSKRIKDIVNERY